MGPENNSIKVRTLMYGWEYPPHISGGLGVACHAIVQSLTRKNIEINLILPYECGGENTSTNKLNIISWNYQHDELIDKKRQNKLRKSASITKINSLLHPYLTTQDYKNILSNHISRFRKIRNSLTQFDFYSDGFSPIELTGHYGNNLFSEVWRYANIAGALANEINHDVIHAHDWMTILAGINAKHISKKPLIFHVHALEIDRSGIDHINREIYAIEKYGMEQADRIISVSNYTKNLIIKHYGIPANKITAVYNGVDASYAASKTDTQEKEKYSKMVLFLGRVTYQKGPHAFVEIAKRILEKRQDVQFVIAGDGNLLAETIEHVAQLRIGQNVHFTGFLDEKKVKEIYRLADVYVMPSVSEPFGLSCLEALANGVPVVISKQSGALEALEHTLHADFWDINEMAEKILAALDHQALRKELLANVQRKMKYLTWDRAGQDIIKVYNELINFTEQK